MTTPIRLSIVIPSYNCAPFLAQTLATIARQDYAPFEVIVVDGASKDRTRDVVAAYGPLVTRFLSEPDKGQLDAMRKGIALANGDVINWMNADDAVMPGAYRAVADAFAADPSIDMVFSDEYVFGEESELVYLSAHLRTMDFWDQFLFRAHMPSETVYWRRELTERALPIDTSIRCATDVSVILPMQYRARLKWLPAPLAAFRVRHGQNSAKTAHQAQADLDLIEQRLAQRIGLTPDGLRRQRLLRLPRHFLAFWIYWRGYSALRFVGRKLTGDRARRKMARFLLDEWLKPPPHVQAVLADEAPASPPA